jgi:hypothetical protein
MVRATEIEPGIIRWFRPHEFSVKHAIEKKCDTDCPTRTASPMTTILCPERHAHQLRWVRIPPAALFEEPPTFPPLRRYSIVARHVRKLRKFILATLPSGCVSEIRLRYRSKSRGKPSSVFSVLNSYGIAQESLFSYTKMPSQDVESLNI